MRGEGGAIIAIFSPQNEWPGEEDRILTLASPRKKGIEENKSLE